MILIDEVLEFAPPRVTCKLTVREGQTFVEEGRVHGLVCIEYMAQTIGAYVGMVRRSHGQPIRVGFLLGTREMTLRVDELRMNDELLLTAEHVFGQAQIGSFRCTVSRRGEEIASAVINVFQSEDEEVANA